MEFITLAILSALCLVFPLTRIYAVIGTGLLLYFYFYAALGLLFIAGLIVYFFRKHQRRTQV